jgi:hypothetical protein
MLQTIGVKKDTLFIRRAVGESSPQGVSSVLICSLIPLQAAEKELAFRFKNHTIIIDCASCNTASLLIDVLQHFLKRRVCLRDNQKDMFRASLESIPASSRLKKTTTSFCNTLKRNDFGRDYKVDIILCFQEYENALTDKTQNVKS